MYTEHSGGQVVIKKIANGYLVTLPVLELSDNLKMLYSMPGIVRKVQEGDPLLDNLQGKDEQGEPEQQYAMAVCTNQFIFKSFTTVLSFLREKMTSEGQE